MNQIPVVNADVVTGFSICILLVVVLGVSKDTFIPLKRRACDALCTICVSVGDSEAEADGFQHL